MNEAPKGHRFSQLYLRNSELLPDSERARRRIGFLIGENFFAEDFGQVLARELGIPIPGNSSYASAWPSIVKDLDLRDFLDLITVRYKKLNNQFQQERSRVFQARFLKAAREIFAEEDLRYRIDDLGGVHLTVDEAFEAVRISVITALIGVRYNGVRSVYEQGFSYLDKSPPDGKGALRSSFFATESLFRLMFPTSHQLSGGEVQKHLEPLVNRIYADQKPAIYLAQKQVASFKDWIDGAHFYRHEPGAEEPSQPPLELAIYMITQAGGHIRWLAKLDAMSNQPASS
ncbi:hypothetical protein HGP14_09580 [Rhizobium sp. P32RR-XVIII]|uniref:hypothetical protein n=1 Tax=Rhizobium sp. P32RR-XVIII TaxID=2726738 RepID=UPI0014568C75|nr:hypothetical protein [Rhizobium sp. P32RR-XVIII]NLS03608.1 hypothetical protein [Rhizobium sp. P32RR-XVIII]